MGGHEGRAALRGQEDMGIECAVGQRGRREVDAHLSGEGEEVEEGQGRGKEDGGSVRGERQNKEGLR